MPDSSHPLRKLGFLTIGLFDGDDPRPGHESTLRVIELGEQLGFDSAWVRHRHLQYGISSPVALLSAASQRTSRIDLGTAVIPLGWENPLRLAEDLATVDLLSGGRLNPGVSVGPPMRWDEVKGALCRSPSSTRTTSRSSPTSRPGSVRPWAGDRRADEAVSRACRSVHR
ncbi:MAG TPA: LLM class flavin-dependent oxidoreductase, partial [Nocardioides sp.]|nr:LLM class flavin-dependent oxidoreductase [Nocardioides sp.]